MKVIHALDYQLLVNHSYSGSTVSSCGFLPACFPERIRRLAANSNKHPDYILIYLGLNDVARYVDPEVFAINYQSMLQHTHKLYPNAEVWCGTLCRGYLNHPNRPLFVDLDTRLPLGDYNEAIKSAALHEACHLADLASFAQTYSSMDGVHPDAKGMELLATLWLVFLQPIAP